MKLHELTDILTTDMNFEFDQNKKIGHIRCQYGYDKLIANQFVPSEDLGNKILTYGIDLERLNKVADCIQFKLIQDFEVLLTYCKGSDLKEETNYFLQDGNVNYWIRLSPTNSIDDYNCYIHFYHE